MGKTLGIGAFAKVKKARHIITEKEVAVKIISKSRIKQNSVGEKVYKEIKMMKKLDHPNIIKLLQVVDTTSDIYIIMELVNGGELFELISNKGRLQESEARQFFQQIISGVEYIHEHQIAHRDLKPENILIQDGMIKIGDFGLSNIMLDGQELHTSCGSPNYAAPEIIMNQQYSGQSVDTWSLGVTLYALIVGYLPFDEDVIPRLFQKIKTADYEIPDHVSDQAKDLIKRIFQPNTDYRLRFDQIKYHPWIYMHIEYPLSFCQIISYKQKRKLNQCVFQQLLDFEQEFNDFQDQLSIIDAIQRKKKFQFVVTYDILLIYHEKNNIIKKESYFFDNIHFKYVNLLENFNNYYKNKLDNKKSKYYYGYKITLPAQQIIKIVIICLQFLNVVLNYQFQYINILSQVYLKKEIIKYDKSYYLECSYSDNYRKLSQNLSDEGLNENKLNIQDRSFTFNVQVFRIIGMTHLLDIKLTKGFPIHFLQLQNLFLQLIKKVVKIDNI